MNLSKLGQRLIYEPVTAVVTRDLECLHFSGPIERYFGTKPSGRDFDLIALAPANIKSKLSEALSQAISNDHHVVISGTRLSRSSEQFSIDVRPTSYAGQRVFLICFGGEADFPPAPQQGSPNVEDLAEAVLHASTSPYHQIGRDMTEAVGETAPDGAHVFEQTPSESTSITYPELESLFGGTRTDVLLLDSNLHIRFFSKGMKSWLGILPDDIGKSFLELDTRQSNKDLASDVATVLMQQSPIEREVADEHGNWCARRIFPYRAADGAIAGVAVALEDITALRSASDPFAIAHEQGNPAELTRSNFLAAVSRYLREPLQSLALLQGVIAKKLEGDAAQGMVALLDQAVNVMSGTLGILVDIDQLGSGTLQVDTTRFVAGDLIRRLAASFESHATLQGIDLRMVACSLFVRSDPRLLEQMMRILLLNSLKNTPHGKIVVGCRRRGSVLRIQIRDNGWGIPDGHLQPLPTRPDLFGGPAAERSRGFGLSLARQLGSLLGHRLDVVSGLGKGTTFTIEVPLLENDGSTPTRILMQQPQKIANDVVRRAGTILIVEDDPKTYELLEQLLREEGHTLATARDEMAALEMMARGSIRPDLILADYSLLHRPDQLAASSKLREKSPRRVPMIVLVGDSHSNLVEDLPFQPCVYLTKPVRAAEIAQVIQHLLIPQDSPAQPKLNLGDLIASSDLAIDPMPYLTERQRQVMQRVLAGQPSKNIAADLGISRRTVENHRASIMRKTGARSIAELARMAVAASRKSMDQA